MISNIIFRAEEILESEIADELIAEGINPDALAAGGILAFIMAFLLIALIIAIALYIFSSIVYMKIAKKAGHPSPGIAWVPFVGPALISSKIAGMHWWPILLLIGMIIPFVGFLFMIAFYVFMIIWTWKVFEAFEKPAWLAILMIIPLLNLVPMIMIIIIAFDSSKYSGPKLK